MSADGAPEAEEEAAFAPERLEPGAEAVAEAGDLHAGGDGTGNDPPPDPPADLPQITAEQVYKGLIFAFGLAGHYIAPHWAMPPSEAALIAEPLAGDLNRSRIMQMLAGKADGKVGYGLLTMAVTRRGLLHVDRVKAFAERIRRPAAAPPGWGETDGPAHPNSQ